MSTTPPVSTGSFDEAEETLTEALAQETSTALVETRWQAFWNRLLLSRNIVITLVGIIIFIFFSLATDKFLTADNLFNMIRNVSITGVVAVGMTFLIIAGEIDLSVGSVLGFLTIVLGVLVSKYGIDPWVGMLISIIMGCLVGLLNGIIRTKVGIPSFILTLAGLTAYRSLALIVSNQQPLTVDGVGVFYDLTGGYLAGTVPWLIIWMLVMMLLGALILSQTKFGYHVYATGGNIEAARNSGINTDWVKTACFILVGGLCGLSSALLLGYLHVAAPITGTGFEFRVIGAVIVGGVVLTGGRGTIYGVLLGAVIIGMITTGLVLLGLSQHFGDIASGLFILIIGALDLYVRRLASRSLKFLET
ncbi:MAG: ABC transporter permease [Anaerolineae bacterium]|nr:ABC transporter permease [Anaerolineae bacterium]